MLYLRNTNQIQSLAQQIERGGVAALTPGFISASYTTNTASLFIITNDATTKLSTTASATTNFSASANSIVSASVAGTAITSSNLVTLFVSASDGSLYYSASSTGSALMTNFTVGSNVRYTISSSVKGDLIPTADGWYRTYFTGYFADNPNWFDTATVTSSGVNTSPIALGTNTGSANLFSIQWKGYFKPTTTERYTFILTSDDASYYWLGGAATASVMTTSSALINNGGIHSEQTVTGSSILTAGTLYPIRLQFGENAGGEILSMSFYTPTIATSSNMSGFIFYNTDTNGY